MIHLVCPSDPAKPWVIGLALFLGLIVLPVVIYKAYQQSKDPNYKDDGGNPYP